MYVAFNGLQLGDGTNYVIRSIDGLDSLPDVSIGMVAKPRRHGSWLGGKLGIKRVVTIELDVIGDLTDDNRTTKPKLALQNACQLSDVEVPLEFDLGEGEPPCYVMASVTSFDAPITQGYLRRRPVVIEFTATDPVKYGMSPKNQATTPPKAPPATPYGVAYGFAYSEGTATSGTFTVSNAGNTRSNTRITIKGPVNNPTVTLTDGQATRTARFNVNLVTSDLLVIDSKENTVLLNGADRLNVASGALVADMFVRPGTTTVEFGGIFNPASNPEATLTVEWRDTSN